MEADLGGQLQFFRSLEYESRQVRHFRPETIVLAGGSLDNDRRAALADSICRVYPDATILHRPDVPHNRIELAGSDPLDLHYQGKKTLVLGIHKSALRYSRENSNTCPNYWHFSPYGFCPYDCRYCYLAATPGVKFSPTVKIFLNLPEILQQVESTASKLSEPTTFYVGKLQDALALDGLTGYSRLIVPFFAAQEHARCVMLTKNADVENLLDLDHRRHTILSWSLNPPEIARQYELNSPSPTDRVAAMRRCAEAGYPVRAVMMPIIPVEGWPMIYSRFLIDLLESVPLNRITLGQICSFPAAMRLTEQKLGRENPISDQLDTVRSRDGRLRFPIDRRIEVYRRLIRTIRDVNPNLDIGLCMEETPVFEALAMTNTIGRCNCTP